MDGELDDLRARIERIEATEQIRQLAARYALALDSRDVDALVALFVPDVTTGDGYTFPAVPPDFPYPTR